MAYEFYISITGAKQGKFKGDSVGEKGTKDSRAKGKIAGIRYSAETTSPRDAATGQATGKRIHKPITITKEWDAASPQIFAALVSNETLKTVLFEFVKPDAAGREEIYFTVTLTNAVISNVHSYLDLTDTSGDKFDAHDLEDVSFVIQKSTIEKKEANTVAEDDWLL